MAIFRKVHTPVLTHAAWRLLVVDYQMSEASPCLQYGLSSSSTDHNLPGKACLQYLQLRDLAIALTVESRKRISCDFPISLSYLGLPNIVTIRKSDAIHFHDSERYLGDISPLEDEQAEHINVAIQSHHGR